MYSRLITATALCAAALFAADETKAQTQSEIYALIGDIDLIQSSLFTANRAFHQVLCPAYKYEHFGTVVSRMEYGSLTSDEKEKYDSIVAAQSNGNLALIGQISSTAQQEEICRSLSIAMGEYILAFREKHPELFE